MGGITKMAASVPVVPMDRGNNTTCTINLHGATIVSWRVNNQEQLFVSKKSVFDGRKPIRGGIPFIFPQFGTWHYGTNGPPIRGPSPRTSPAAASLPGVQRSCHTV